MERWTWEVGSPRSAWRLKYACAQRSGRRRSQGYLGGGGRRRRKRRRVSVALAAAKDFRWAREVLRRWERVRGAVTQCGACAAYVCRSKREGERGQNSPSWKTPKLKLGPAGKVQNLHRLFISTSRQHKTKGGTFSTWNPFQVTSNESRSQNNTTNQMSIPCPALAQRTRLPSSSPSNVVEAPSPIPQKRASERESVCVCSPASDTRGA